MLQEFRNRTADLAAAGSESVAETAIQGLESLVSLIDASLRTADPIISDLNDVVARAVTLARPELGEHVSVTTHVGSRTGIKNSGSSLECLIAALLVDLAHGHATNLRLFADVARGALEIELESDGGRPSGGPSSSWRFLLACDLAARLGATIVSPPEVASYLVRFR